MKKILITLITAFMAILTLNMPVRAAVPTYRYKATSPVRVTNVSMNDYWRFADVLHGNLYVEDGTLIRVQYDYDNRSVCVEYLTSDFKVKKTVSIKSPFDSVYGFFGGFHCGKDYNFLVFGQSNLEEDDIADGYTNASFVIDGEDLTTNITAEGDGINSGTDLTIKSGNITLSSGDDGIKADYILTIGGEGTEGPVINVKKAGEAIEGATINIYSGNITVNSTDDGINAANKDLTDYTYSLNIMGGTINITAGADGIDSNGNVNILGGLTTIVRSASNGGEGGLDYEGICYVKEGCLVNPYGTTMDSGKGGMGGNRGWGGQNAQNGGRPGRDGQNDSESGATPEAPGQNGNSPEPPEGEIRDENGNIIERNDGQRPEWGGPRGEKGQRGGEQPPENSGEAPQDQNDAQDSTEETEELNFFQKLINFIIGLFKK